VEICYIPWAKSFFLGFFMDFGGFWGWDYLDWGKFMMGLFYDGERNCGGWGKLWLGFLGLEFLDEVWGMLWWRINRIKMS